MDVTVFHMFSVYKSAQEGKSLDAKPARNHHMWKKTN